MVSQTNSSLSKIHTHTPRAGPAAEGQRIPSKDIPDPLHELRIWLSQQKTAFYGFPLGLQLLAFEAVPQLLARIPDAPNTVNFMEDPSTCATTVIILNTKDILAVEAEPDVTVHFSLIPEAERHMWLYEVEDLQVNRLVHRLSSGHTSATEDFRGAEKSFRGRGKQPENAPLPPEDKPKVVPIFQRNLELLQNMARGIYERLETMERNICSHLGVSPPNVHNTQKMKVDDDSPKTDGIQAQRPPRKSRRTNSTVTKPATKIHSYPQHSADRLQGNKGRTSPYFNKESQDDNDCAHDRTPPFDEHVNYQSVIDEPPCISDLTPTKRFGDEKPVTVTWEETNPHAYTSGKIAPTSETPPSAAYRVSGPHLPSPRTAADVETLSRNVSATKTQSAAATEGASRDSVAVGNERSPIEEDENYESCQENISIDTPLQEKHPLAVETFPGPDTDEDDSSMESGGKRLRKKSQKICGVYTPDARLKGLFMSEKKTEYRPLPKTSCAIFKKFSDILSENLVQQFEIKTSHIVTNSFFLDIATPGKWLSDETSNVTILDSFITENPTEAHVDVQMTPILKSLPYILEQYVGYTVYQISEGVRFYSWNRVEGISHNKRGGDCASCAAKFIEMHCNGDEKEEMSLITNRVVDKIREQYAMDCYEEFVGDYQVANEAI
ncbi:hypothetical protein Bca4012_029150 [Brassica carinata]